MKFEEAILKMFSTKEAQMTLYMSYLLLKNMKMDVLVYEDEKKGTTLVRWCSPGTTVAETLDKETRNMFLVTCPRLDHVLLRSQHFWLCADIIDTIYMALL